MKTKDALGDRMKSYEGQYSVQKMLPRIPIIVRIDGRAFSNFTKGLKRPYDERLSSLMVETTLFLVKETGAIVGYTQSDEISLCWFSESPKSQIFFGGKVLKMSSVLASMTTAFFNANLKQAIPEKSNLFAFFDCRVFNAPNTEEAANYFLWREQDAVKNSITMAASCYYLHSELDRKTGSEKQEMLHQKGVNWNDYPFFFRRGTYIQKRNEEIKLTDEQLYKLPEKHQMRSNPEKSYNRSIYKILEMEPLSKIKNRKEVLLFRAPPIYFDENKNTLS